MTDFNEPKLQRTRQRSLASKRHKFEFIGASQRAVFPIMKRSEDGLIELCGTGFFIAPGGIFATAKHVFEESEVGSADQFEIIQEGGDHLMHRSVIEIVNDKHQDLAVGQLKPAHEECESCENHPIVGIMRLDPEIHEVLGAFAYSHTVIGPPEMMDVGDGPELGQRVRYRSHWEMGLAEEIYPDGLGFVKGRCFGTSIFVEGRASGGPVFNSNGFVIGLNCRSFAEPEGLPHSTATSIGGLFPIVIAGRSIAEWRKGKKYGRIAVRSSLF